MKKLITLFSFLKNYKGFYFLALIFTFASRIVVAMQPQLIRITIDSVLKDAPFESDWLSSLVRFFIGENTDLQALIIMAIFIFVFAILGSLFTYGKSIFASASVEGATKELRDKMYNHIQLLPFAFHKKSNTGDLIQRCTSDINNIKRALYSQILEIISSSFWTVYVLYLMFNSSFQLMLFSCGIMMFFFISSIIFHSKVEKEFEKAEELESKMTTVIQENLTGIRVIKAFRLHNSEIKKFKNASEKYRDKNLNIELLYAIFYGIIDTVVVVHVAGIAIYGGVLAYHNIISLGSLVAFISYAAMLSYPLVNLARIIGELGQSFVSVTRIQKILLEQRENIFAKKEKPEILGNIEFNSVSFAYPDAPETKTLVDISLTIKAGQTIAVLGHTGSGKSSLVHLLSRLYGYSGSIKIDGNELSSIDKGWIRSNIGLILQEPFLYGKTILENIRLAVPGASEEVVKEYAKLAALDDEVVKFKDGYNTKIGERGVSLSGGQKQRLAIARSLIKETPIIVFDDSLSAVDTETDEKIRKAIASQKGKKTIIIISHRISTVVDADKIFVLQKGKLIQEGNHQELITQDGWYKRIYDIQKK